MNSYQELICKMKIAQQDLQTIHHNMHGGVGEWIRSHEIIGDYYGMLSDMTDDLIEIGISIGIAEPSIVDAINYQKTISGDFDVRKALQKTKDILVDIADMMQAIGNEIDEEERYIQSKLDEYIYTLRKEAEYKLAKALK